MDEPHTSYFITTGKTDLYRIGDIVHFGGNLWEIESFDTDPDGFLAIGLVEPNMSNEALQAGESAARIVVRDILGIRFTTAA